jgi:hypothetical protein
MMSFMAGTRVEVSFREDNVNSHQAVMAMIQLGYQYSRFMDLCDHHVFGRLRCFVVPAEEVADVADLLAE